jgi:hypothetical protein
VIVTFWLDGSYLFSWSSAEPPAIGDRIMARWMSSDCFVVSERLHIDYDTGPAVAGWHIVLRRPEMPAESTPPWMRKEEPRQPGVCPNCGGSECPEGYCGWMDVDE